VSTKEIVDTMQRESTLEVPKRREYSKQMKALVLQQCSQEGASVAGVALSHGLNPNMVHRWIREERQHNLGDAGQVTSPQFIPLQLPAAAVIEAEPPQACPPGTAQTGAAIHIEVRRGSAAVSIHWPMDSASSCAAWLRDWLR
jgi:transposase